MNRQNLSDLIRKYKLDLIFNKLNLILLVVFIVLLIILLATNLRKTSNQTDVSVSGIALGGDCSQSRAGCDTGLSCVEADTNVFRCSDLKNFSSCDKTAKACNEGKCVNTGPHRTDGKNYHFCSLGLNTNFCGVDTDCASGFKCEKFGFINEGRCVPSDRAERKNVVYCETDAGCADGFKCVTGAKEQTAGVIVKYCSNLSKGQRCDVDSKQCGAGLSCYAIDYNPLNSWLDYVCGDGKEDSGCMQQSDCQSGYACNNVDGRTQKVCTLADRSQSQAGQTLCSKTNPATACGGGQTCVKQNPTGAAICTKGENFQACDIDGSGCAAGFRCLNTGPGRADKVNYFRCTNGENNSMCVVDSDCKDASLKCVNIEGVGERRCVKKNQEDVTSGNLCDSVTLCKVGLKCIKPYDTRSNIGLCSSGEKLNVCLTNADCASGLICKTSEDNQFVKKCQENVAVACGPLDVDTNDTIDFKDFAKFIGIWKSNCNDSPLTGASCGAMDTDNNSFIDQKDFFNFVSKWKKPSCSI